MRLIGRLVLGALILALIGVLTLAGWIYVAPPDLLRVATGYAAKIVCSNVFIAGRDPAQVLAEDVQAPGHPILKLVKVTVDRDEKIVTAKLLGFFAPGIAVARDGLGCASVPDGQIASAKALALPEAPLTPRGPGLWPEGDEVATNEQVQALLADAQLTGPGLRAAIIVKDGRIIAETYAPGFDERTPLLGWSMTKTVNAVLIGMAEADGKLQRKDQSLFADLQNDSRKSIAIYDLLSMASGLAFNEDYGDVADVTRMLYLEPDMAGFAGKQKAMARPREEFNYSSGTGVLLSRIWMDRVGEGALTYPREKLFGPIGMNSAVFEADEAGTYVGSSYLYATARDWARFGQFLLQNGEWNGAALVPPGLIGDMQTTNGLRGGYSNAQTWMDGPRGAYGHEIGLPPGIFWLEGHDGQSIAIVPSAQMVVVRLGLTPSKLGYGTEDLVKAALAASGG